MEHFEYIHCDEAGGSDMWRVLRQLEGAHYRSMR
jgi:hypothetical protein